MAAPGDDCRPMQPTGEYDIFPSGIVLRRDEFPPGQLNGGSGATTAPFVAAGNAPSISPGPGGNGGVSGLSWSGISGSGNDSQCGTIPFHLSGVHNRNLRHIQAAHCQKLWENYQHFLNHEQALLQGVTAIAHGGRLGVDNALPRNGFSNQLAGELNVSSTAQPESARLRQQGPQRAVSVAEVIHLGDSSEDEDHKKDNMEKGKRVSVEKSTVAGARSARQQCEKHPFSLETRGGKTVDDFPLDPSTSIGSATQHNSNSENKKESNLPSGLVGKQKEDLTAGKAGTKRKGSQRSAPTTFQSKKQQNATSSVADAVSVTKDTPELHPRDEHSYASQIECNRQSLTAPLAAGPVRVGRDDQKQTTSTNPRMNPSAGQGQPSEQSQESGLFSNSGVTASMAPPNPDCTSNETAHQNFPQLSPLNSQKKQSKKQEMPIVALQGNYEKQRKALEKEINMLKTHMDRLDQHAAKLFQERKQSRTDEKLSPVPSADTIDKMKLSNEALLKEMDSFEASVQAQCVELEHRFCEASANGEYEFKQDMHRLIGDFQVKEKDAQAKCQSQLETKRHEEEAFLSKYKSLRWRFESHSSTWSSQNKNQVS